jgi:hypothetical protein
VSVKLELCEKHDGNIEKKKIRIEGFRSNELGLVGTKHRLSRVKNRHTLIRKT